mgnify:CR=1 FL=1
MKNLVDSHGRRVRKLRLSFTDKCNLRCHYCMPVDSTFMDEEKYLHPSEYEEIVRDLCSYGLEEIRITGGEPLMRKSFKEIVERLSGLPVKKIGLTTNAILLDKYIEILKANRVNHLNISLDSLDPQNFKKITYGNQLERVLKNIRLAKDHELEVKINVVAMKGINDHEIIDFVEYSSELGVEVRFLEVMRIGHACSSQNDQFISAQEIINILKSKYELKRVSKEYDSTSFNYILNNGAQIGFIASESQPFCGSCSRWRLSADGSIKACLLKDDGLSIKGKSSKEREDIYHTLLGMKPFLRPTEVAHQMNVLGG